MIPADDWWHSLSQARREQIHAWISVGGHLPPEDPDQTTIDDLLVEGTRG